MEGVVGVSLLTCVPGARAGDPASAVGVLLLVCSRVRGPEPLRVPTSCCVVVPVRVQVPCPLRVPSPVCPRLWPLLPFYAVFFSKTLLRSIRLSDDTSLRHVLLISPFYLLIEVGSLCDLVYDVL